MDKNMQQTYPAEMPMESPMQQQSMPCPYMNTCPYANTCPYMQQNMGQSMMQPGQSGNQYQGENEMRSQYFRSYYPYPPY